MIDLPEVLTVILLAVLAGGVVAFGLSLLALAARRRPRGGRPAGPAGRWGSDEDVDRLRRVYFQKERRARAIRERERQARAAEARRRQEAGPAAGDGQATAPPAGPSEWRYRAVLELEGEVTPERVRLAYKRMIAAYHPDKVAGLGAKLQRLAEEETKAINEAYAFFRDRYGF